MRCSESSRFDDSAFKTRSSIRLVSASIFSFAWISLTVWLVVRSAEPFLAKDLNEIGDFLAGAFAPLAFLWLVIGYFQQGDELRLTRDEVSRQANELAKSVKHQEALADFAKRTYEIDLETRSRTNDIQKLQAQPLFRDLEGGMHEPRPNIKNDNWKIIINVFNHSVNCWDFIVLLPEFDDIDGFIVQNPRDPVPSFAKGAEQRIVIDVPEDYSKIISNIIVRFEYKDALFEQTSIDFKIKIGPKVFELISETPYF